MIKFTEFISESVTVQQRQKRSLVARRTARIRATKRKLKSRKRKPESELKVKARRAARKKIMQRFTAGGNFSKLPPSAKQQIEKMVDKKQKSLEKIAMRLLPVVRKDEAVRLSKISKKKAAKVGKSSIRISGLDAY
ncbi:MAG TPA: hypothetical protein DCX27_07685 [Balneola sp.]|nr:hypothetical protein [Balneola sp.]